MKNQVVEAKKLKFIYNASITLISLLACFLLDLARVHGASSGFLTFFFFSAFFTNSAYQDYLKEAKDSNKNK